MVRHGHASLHIPCRPARWGEAAQAKSRTIECFFGQLSELSTASTNGPSHCRGLHIRANRAGNHQEEAWPLSLLIADLPNSRVHCLPSMGIPAGRLNTHKMTAHPETDRANRIQPCLRDTVRAGVAAQVVRQEGVNRQARVHPTEAAHRVDAFPHNPAPKHST